LTGISAGTGTYESTTAVRPRRTSSSRTCRTCTTWGRAAPP